jgi:GT2 family glycosyltransferase
MIIEKYISQFLATGNIHDLLNTIRFLRINKYYYIALFISLQLYPYYSFHHELMNEIAICMHYIGKYEDSWNLYNRIFTINCSLTEDHLKVYSANAASNFKHIFKNPDPVDNTIIQLLQTNRTSLNLVTFSITTCKRYDLFEKTMNSFLNNCRDLHLIKRWICVDDNSSEEDRHKMREKYPFFEFVWKTPEQKGHARSMNIIMNMVNTPYLFHMEDDWQYIHPNNYITQCIEVLQENPAYGQCLINKNYAETIEDFQIIGGELKKTINNTRYFEHVHETDMNKFIEKYGPGLNCAYWTHYSLRPGLNRVNILKHVGEYVYGIPHFEMDFSKRYFAKGFKTVFLDRIHCIHIGRLTKQINDKSILNAYDLNDEKQF